MGHARLQLLFAQSPTEQNRAACALHGDLCLLYPGSGALKADRLQLDADCTLLEPRRRLVNGLHISQLSPSLHVSGDVSGMKVTGRGQRCVLRSVTSAPRPPVKNFPLFLSLTSRSAAWGVFRNKRSISGQRLRCLTTMTRLIKPQNIDHEL
ncbi:hypothetical protein D5F01_LYC00114 [Larimichthys crocea]|uniref:Uncharacterized protein n=1 Tax=Larimichthys crocea TaxID=215358 RepID=A0A6G0J888_LARCR|nr:hypothetical protein D5F01_LYC00114 [Larimichthys crocea]